MSAAKTDAQASAKVLSVGEPTKANTLDCADDGAERKAFSTMQAAFALKGYALHRLTDGLLLAERWGYTRTLDGLSQAAQFLTQIGGR